MTTRKWREWRVTESFAISCLALVMAGCGESKGAGYRTGAQATQIGSDKLIAAVTEPVFTVGGANRKEWASFTRVRSVAFTASGDLVLLDADQGRGVVVNPAGDLRHEVSSSDLRAPLSLAVLDDGRLVVYDAERQSFLVFGPDGQLAGQFSAGVIGNVLRALSGDRILAARTSGDGLGRPIDIISLDGSTATFYNAWLMAPDVGETISGEPETSGETRTTDVVNLMEPPRFAPKLLVDVLSDGRVAVVDSIGYRVKMISASGVVTSVLERPILPFDVTPEIEQALRDREEAAAPRRRIVINAPGMSADTRNAIERQIRGNAASRLTFAKQIPVIDDMAVDSDDRIWVARTAGDGVSRGPTDVFTADGNYFGTLAANDIRIPEAFGPDGLMAYVGRDESGSTEVHVVRLLRLEPTADAGS